MVYYYKRKTNPLKWLIIIVILIIIIGLGYWFYVNYFSQIEFPAQLDEQDQVDVEIEELSKLLAVNLSLIEGSVQVNLKNQGYKAGLKNTILHQGDSIKTSANSRAVLIVENGAIIRLNANSEIIFESLSSDNIYIKQLSGRTYHNFKKQGEYQIESLNTKVTALGTRFEFITNKERQFLAVLDFSNRLLVEVNDDDGLVVASRLQAGEKALIDLLADKNNLLKLEEFTQESLVKEEWYKWNFDLDEKIATESSTVEVSEDKDDEPDFTTTDESLELAVETKESGVFFSWSVYNQDDFKNYQLVRSTENNDLKYPEDEVIRFSASLGFNSYLDSQRETDKTTYYRVCVVKTNDKIVCGNVASIKAKEEEETDSLPPTPVSLSIGISVSGVSLIWTANNEGDFKEYRVVKSMINSAPSYPAAGFIVIKNKGQENYLDNQVNITSVGTFYYRVCSLDTSDNVACSNVKVIENGQVK